VDQARHARKQAEAYLRFLYSAKGQALAAKHFYRPAKPDKVPMRR
jgi:ABC-type sulfate transport system substrate-binding protein